MAERSDWYPRSRPNQRAMYANFKAKIGGYVGVIEGLTQAMADRLILICDMYLAIYDGIEMNEATMSDSYDWQKDMEQGDESETVQPPPLFKLIKLPEGAFKGFVKEFRKKVGLLKKMDGYTQAIGADLMIVPVKGETTRDEDRQPNLKYVVAPNYTLRVAGVMDGMRAINFYYRRKGATEYVFVGYLTKLPGEIRITPAVAGQPEVGDIRAIFADNNEEIGQFSQSQEVTLS